MRVLIVEAARGRERVVGVVSERSGRRLWACVGTGERGAALALVAACAWAGERGHVVVTPDAGAVRAGALVAA